MLHNARRLAPSATTVLIRGESGVGKSLLASILHQLGPNADSPFISLDCSVTPPALLEAELFGGERAVNGFVELRRGCLEFAGHGAIVLDEIAALPMPLQARLLRAIEEKRFDRPGGSLSLPFNARVIATSTADLEAGIARRTFREDFYYRLKVTAFSVPPLRDRRPDLHPLAEHFLTQLSELHRRPRPQFSSSVLEALAAYSWPGNVRELRVIIERALLHSAAPEIAVSDLPPHFRHPGNDAAARSHMSLEELERVHIAEILEATAGRKTAAAHILGISRKTLLEKRKRYGFQ